MSHPREQDLNAYLDNELAAGESLRVVEHLGMCPMCAQHLGDIQALRALVRACRPGTAEFSPEGEFWVRLAAKLPARPARAWAWIEVAPPVVLAGILSVLEGAVTLLVLAFALVRLGILPPVGGAVAGQLAAWARSPALSDALLPSLRLTGEGVSAALLTGGLLSETVILGAFVMLALVGAGVVLGLYVMWAVCSARPAMRLR